MDKFFENKWAIRVLSLIFAVALYLYVGVEIGGQNNPNVIPTPNATSEVQVLDDIPLEVRIEDEKVVSGVPDVVSVSLEGQQRILMPVVRQKNFKVFVDLNGLDEGEHTVELQYEDIPNDLKVYIEPKTIDVTIEERASAEFSVEVDFINESELPLGYELGEPEVNPETVTLISSTSMIEQVAMVRTYIDVRDLKESINNKEMRVTVYDSQGNELNLRVEPESVAVSLPVERPSKTVPLNVETSGELPDDLAIDTLEYEENIELFGKRDTLNTLDSVSTEPIDLSDIDKSGEIEVPLQFPDGVTALNDTVKVKVNLNKEKEFKDITLDIDGLDEKDFDITEPKSGKIDVIAMGSEDAIEKLEKKDIKAAARLENQSPGSHKVSLKFEGPENITFEAKVDQITIDIKDSKDND